MWLRIKLFFVYIIPSAGVFWRSWINELGFQILKLIWISIHIYMCIWTYKMIINCWLYFIGHKKPVFRNMNGACKSSFINLFSNPNFFSTYIHIYQCIWTKRINIEFKWYFIRHEIPPSGRGRRSSFFVYLSSYAVVFRRSG